ncbi:MAG: hypothetical protein WC635_10320 [Bacteriovorax sp.]|jgi:hypothetical protein
MKYVLLGFVFAGFAVNIHAADKRTFSKLSSSKAIVKIDTKSRMGIDAANYTDGKENRLFINAMLKDKDSDLAKLKAKIEKDFCPDVKTEGCGEVTFTKETRTSSGRDGWKSGYASYSFFIGFTADGPRKQFYATHIASIFERTQAQTRNDEYLGIILKTLEQGKIKEIEDNTP